MIIQSIFGFFISIVGVGETATTGYQVLSAMKTMTEIQDKKNNDQLGASLHEEAQQIFKDAIREAGKQ